PNVGKSTLLNRILGQKLSITSRKPQTTRHRILGIKTDGPVQAIYIDTPGLQQKPTRAINRFMNREARSALLEVDLVLWVLEAGLFTEEDESVLEGLRQGQVPVIAVLNKIDRLSDKGLLLPYLDTLSRRFAFAALLPVSAKQGQQIELLEQTVAERLPLADHLYGDEELTDRSERFLAAELIREKIMRQLGEEIPYQVAVEIERFVVENEIVHINALIYVEREGQKKILIGQGGERLKRIGQEARLDMERLFGNRVMLTTWVKVKRGWSDDERALKSLGYQERE
ncbi:MAG: GTPase Era, partial [Pseudomonadales bacterium]|nr:GTPase Era [Pseudomonadales bacterium]